MFMVAFRLTTSAQPGGNKSEKVKFAPRAAQRDFFAPLMIITSAACRVLRSIRRCKLGSYLKVYVYKLAKDKASSRMIRERTFSRMQ